MVTGFLPTADFAVHAPGAELLSGPSVEQKMVDADACIADVGIAEIVPEGVDRLVRVQFPDGIRPSLREQFLICSSRLWKKQRVNDPSLRLKASSSVGMTL
jgi:hypothetical protein